MTEREKERMIEDLKKINQTNPFVTEDFRIVYNRAIIDVIYYIESIGKEGDE